MIIISDTRCDSPGFCAQKASTIFQDYETNKIIGVENIDGLQRESYIQVSWLNLLFDV